jgi:hypothetical protein
VADSRSKLFKFKPGVPVFIEGDSEKFTATVGSDMRFASKLTDLSIEEVNYIKYLTDVEDIRPKDLTEISQVQKDRIHSILGTTFNEYPYFENELTSLKDYYVRLSYPIEQRTNFDYSILLSLLKLGLFGVCCEDKSEVELIKSKMAPIWNGKITTSVKTPPKLIALNTRFHDLEKDSCNELMASHIPYLTTLFQGTSAVIFPINVLGKTPCNNCYVRLLGDEKLGFKPKYQFSSVALRDTLSTVSSAIVTSKIQAFLSTGEIANEIIVIRDPDMSFSYLDADFASDCNCNLMNTDFGNTENILKN